MGAADLELLSGFETINPAFVKLVEDLLKEGRGEAFSQLFFSRIKMNSKSPLVEGLFPQAEYLSPFELARCLLLFPPR